MDEVGIILIVLFALLLFVGPITCVTLSRRDAGRVADPQPEHFDRARRKLRRVTTTYSPSVEAARPENHDPEAGAPQVNVGECPICIGPLVPEPAHVRSDNAGPEPEEIASTTLQVHPFGCYLKKAVSPRINAEAETPGSEIVTLKSCGHSFHLQCLASWFLLERHDCPVCRAFYYKSRLHRPTMTVSTPAFY